MAPLRSVLMLHASDEMYGADFILLRTAAALRAAGVTVRVIVPDDVDGERPLSQKLAQLGCAVERHRLAVLRRRYLTLLHLPVLAGEWLTEVLRLRRLLRRERPDLVYSNTLAVTAGAAAAWLCGMPHVWHVHEILVTPRWLGVALARLARRLATKVLAVSEAVARFLRTAAPGLEPVVLHNGIPDPMAELDRHATRARVEREFRMAPDSPLVLFVGRLSDWKGAVPFAEIAARNIRERGGVHFALVGGAVPGDTSVRDRVRTLAADPDLRGMLHCIDFTADVAAYLARATVFVLPSLRPDPFPTVALEAMFAGLPIVTFAHGGVLEMIRPADAGVEVPVGDVDGLRVAIEGLLADPATASAMGARGRARAAEAFSADGFAARITAALRAAVDADA